MLHSRLRRMNVCTQVSINTSCYRQFVTRCYQITVIKIVSLSFLADIYHILDHLAGRHDQHGVDGSVQGRQQRARMSQQRRIQRHHRIVSAENCVVGHTVGALVRKILACEMCCSRLVHMSLSAVFRHIHRQGKGRQINTRLNVKTINQVSFRRVQTDVEKDLDHASHATLSAE